MSLLDIHTEDNLLSGDFPRVTAPVTVLSGQNVVRGQVMGKITASGKYRACNSGLTDGAEVAEAVMAADVDASLSDLPGIVYLTGEFNSNAMTVAALPSVDTLSMHVTALRLRGIFTQGQVSVLGTIT